MFIDTANLSCFVWLSSASRPLRRLGVYPFWGVGQLADRPAVNREVGGSSPPAPVSTSRDGSDPHHHHAVRRGEVETCRAGATLTSLTSLRRASNSHQGTMTRFVFSLVVVCAMACGGARTPPKAPGAATIIPSETDARVTRVEEMLRGVPGVDVTRLPDGNYRLRIRGQRSIRGNPTDDNPLVVIDGISIPNESIGSMLADLSPGDVARIEVLKDASAMSMYGSRGANGVIVITTRRGRGERSP